MLPLAVLCDQRETQPHLRAEIKDVIGRDPRLRQPPRQQQLTMMTSIGTVGLRALLVPTPRGGLRRLRQMHDRSDPPQLLNHEPPAGRRLQRDLELLATEPLTEPAHPGTVRRRDPRPTHLTSLSVQPLRSDLRSMLIKSHYDAIRGLLTLHGFNGLGGHAPRLS